MIDCAPEQVNNNGKTALMLMCENKMYNEAMQILTKNCNPGYENENGDSAESLAYQAGMYDLVSFIRKIAPRKFNYNRAIRKFITNCGVVANILINASICGLF